MAFEDIEFIGWDGEGITERNSDGVATEKIDDWTEGQRYVLLSTSSGEYIYDGAGIPLRERLLFVRKMGMRHPNATHVFFGGSYDFNKILEGLPREIMEELHAGDWTRYDDGVNKWIFRYRPRKELVVGALKKGEYFKPGTPLKEQCVCLVHLWDVIGFFQMSFIATVKAWLGESYPDYELIVAGKKERLTFQESDKDFMIRYNAAETKALVKIMEILHAQLLRLDLKIPSWHGAGAIAGAFFKKHKLMDAYFHSPPGEKRTKIKINLPLPVEEACRFSYFGGRIESGYMGRYLGEIHNYDINSAYPYAASFLPDMTEGEWFHYHSMPTERALELSEFTVYRVQWYFHEDRLYYPFPFRTCGGSVIFPKKGERWIMAPELRSAIRSLRMHDQLYIQEAWEFIPKRSHSPFEVIRDLYVERQKMVAEKDPAEKILKLALNSIYGKLCQKLGWNQKTNTSPRYHFLFFAAWITSFTRARIYDAVQKDPDAVVSINTDGIVTTRPLPGLEISTTKEFGKWTDDKADEILQLQSGVYWIRTGAKWKERARGLGRVIGEGNNDEERESDRNSKILSRIAKIEKGWAAQDPRAHFEVKLFVTSKKAMTGPDWFPRWGGWYIMHDAKTGQVGRGLELHCSGWGKRRLNERIFPDRLTATEPAENILYLGTPGNDNPKKRDLGEPYDLPWINGAAIAEYESDDDILAT